MNVHSLSPTLGAEITGFDPEPPIADDVAHELRDLFDASGVLVFRDLDIDQEQQRKIVYSLLGNEDTLPGEIAPYLVSNREPGGDAPYGRLLFHCDMMWSDDPQPAISLYGMEIEPPSPRTLFASMATGWETLPEELRARVQGLEARHGFEKKYPNRGGDDDVVDAVFDGDLWTTTPVARVHPRTGRTLLYVSQQATIDLIGLTPDENEELLEVLFGYLYDPANVLRHEWRQGDLVVWDNIALQHARESVSLDGPVRTLRKVVGPHQGALPTFPAYSKAPTD